MAGRRFGFGILLPAQPFVARSGKALAYRARPFFLATSAANATALSLACNAFRKVAASRNTTVESSALFRRAASSICSSSSKVTSSLKASPAAGCFLNAIITELLAERSLVP
jgi:hypothetical protein